MSHPAKPLPRGFRGFRWGICALLFLATTINYMVAGASVVNSAWTATLLIGLAAAAHQGFAANLFTLVSDTAPRFTVSSIVGIGGMAAGIGGMFNAKLAGYVLERTGNYLPLFILASLAYLIALGIIHWLNPRLEPMRVEAQSHLNPYSPYPRPLGRDSLAGIDHRSCVRRRYLGRDRTRRPSHGTAGSS